MGDSRTSRPLTGWQRAHVLSAAKYVRELTLRAPGNDRARAVYEGLLEVLEPTRRIARQYREQQEPPAVDGSMWEQRSERGRRAADRRTTKATSPAGGERRGAQRRSGRDRRTGR